MNHEISLSSSNYDSTEWVLCSNFQLKSPTGCIWWIDNSIKRDLIVSRSVIYPGDDTEIKGENGLMEMDIHDSWMVLVAMLVLCFIWQIMN